METRTLPGRARLRVLDTPGPRPSGPGPAVLERGGGPQDARPLLSMHDAIRTRTAWHLDAPAAQASTGRESASSSPGSTALAIASGSASPPARSARRTLRSAIGDDGVRDDRRVHQQLPAVAPHRLVDEGRRSAPGSGCSSRGTGAACSGRRIAKISSSVWISDSWRSTGMERRIRSTIAGQAPAARVRRLRHLAVDLDERGVEVRQEARMLALDECVAARRPCR